jgi:hypothetical protein
MGLLLRAGACPALAFVVLTSGGVVVAQDAPRLQELWATRGIKLIAPFIQVDAIVRPQVTIRLLTEDGGQLQFTAASFAVESAGDGLRIVPKGPGTILVYAQGRTMRVRSTEVVITSDGWARFTAQGLTDMNR